VSAGAGRPKSSSRRTIEEAAAELFLESGYASTTVDEIATRAGVSRATVFNYVSSKSDLLWLDVDDALDALEAELDAGSSLGDALSALAAASGPDRVSLAVAQSEVMGTADELAASGFPRLRRLAALVRRSRSASPTDSHLATTVWTATVTAAVWAAWLEWTDAGVARRPLADYLAEALAQLGHGIVLEELEQ
jgi:AcrR family transcriptional regulator